MWRTPRHKPFRPTGITLGTTVTGAGIGPGRGRPRGVEGQVWGRAPAPVPTRARWWWVVSDDGTAYLCNEANLTVRNQCIDTPLAAIDAA